MKYAYINGKILDGTKDMQVKEGFVILTDNDKIEDIVKAGRERQAEVGTVAELLEEIESENLYQVLVTVDGRTLKIVLLKMQGYSTKEIAPLVHLTTGAIYARLDHLRKKLRKIL